MPRTLRSLAVIPLACLLLSGCRVSEHQNGTNENVNIGTPFGSMQVKTTNSTDTSAIGLTAYPGAVPMKDDDDKDGNSANVNMSFGSFHLGVKAASFQTHDSQDKVLAFYRKDLAERYGDIIECRGDNPIGSLTHTSQGLTCDTKSHNHISTGISSGDKIELRAGSDQRQHIVGVESRDGGTRIGLVALDLPSHHSGHTSE
jgi:uncharacterized protein YoaH (UPF0181 family)